MYRLILALKNLEWCLFDELCLRTDAVPSWSPRTSTVIDLSMMIIGSIHFVFLITVHVWKIQRCDSSWCLQGHLGECSYKCMLFRGSFESLGALQSATCVFFSHLFWKGIDLPISLPTTLCQATTRAILVLTSSLDLFWSRMLKNSLLTLIARSFTNFIHFDDFIVFKVSVCWRHPLPTVLPESVQVQVDHPLRITMYISHRLSSLSSSRRRR